MKNQRRFAPTKTGRLAPEWVAAFLRNQWPESAEYAGLVAYGLIGSIVTATVGAVVLLYLVRLFKKA